MSRSVTAPIPVAVLTTVLMTVLTAVFVLAACVSGDETDPPGSAQSAATTVAVVEDTGAGSASPLEATLGFPSDPERRKYQLISMQRDADQAMVQCMKRAGFYYAVRPAEELFRSGAFIGDGTRQWTGQNGLGITSSFAKALAADVASHDATDAATSNLDYVASLTEEQALDYDRALVGEAGAAAGTQAYEPGGCFAEAFTDILHLLSVVDEFQSGLASLNSRLDNDPRVLQFQAEWSACMDSLGYDYANENAMVDDVYARLLDIELVDQAGITRVVSVDVLDALATYEREVAVAAFDCRLDFADELAQLRHDYEQEFLDDNRFRIAELLAPAS